MATSKIKILLFVFVVNIITDTPQSVDQYPISNFHTIFSENKKSIPVVSETLLWMQIPLLLFTKRGMHTFMRKNDIQNLGMIKNEFIQHLRQIEI